MYCARVVCWFCVGFVPLETKSPADSVALLLCRAGAPPGNLLTLLLPLAPVEPPAVPLEKERSNTDPINGISPQT